MTGKEREREGLWDWERPRELINPFPRITFLGELLLLIVDNDQSQSEDPTGLK